MKKMILSFIIISIFVICFLTKQSNNIVKDNIIFSANGEKILKGEKEYITLDSNSSFDNSKSKKTYLKVTDNENIYIKKIDDNNVVVFDDIKNKVSAEINLGSSLGEIFKLDNSFLYYTRHKNKIETLYVLDIKSKKQEKLIDSKYGIDNYLVNKNTVFVDEMGAYTELNQKTKEKKEFDFGSGWKLFDFNEDELFFYQTKRNENKICFLKISKKIKKDRNVYTDLEKNNCNLEVSFNEKKEDFIGNPIKLRDNVYVLRFGKFKGMNYLYHDISIFNFTLFSIPISKIDYISKIYLKAVDLNKNKVIINKMTLDRS